MKKNLFYFKIAIFLFAFVGIYSCQKEDDIPTPDDNQRESYSIGDTLISQFVDDETNEVLQSVVFEIINIGTTTDTVPFIAVKSHSNLEATEQYPHRFFNVVTKTEMMTFINDFKDLHGDEAGKKLYDLSRTYNGTMAEIAGGYIESEMNIDDYFKILEELHLFYKDESLDNAHIKNAQVKYFLKFIFAHEIDIDDLIKLLSDNGYSLNDLLIKMGELDFTSMLAEYSQYTDDIGITGFNEFITGFFNENKSASVIKEDDAKKVALEFVGKAAQQLLTDAGSSFDSNTYSEKFSLLNGDDTNPMNYAGAKEANEYITWHSGANYDNIKIKTTCDYNQKTSLSEGLFVSNAQVSFLDVKIGSYHHVNTEISSSSVNKGSFESPIAEIRTGITVKLTVKCIWSTTYTDNYIAHFNAKDGISLKKE